MHDLRPILLARTDFPPLRRRRLDTLQVNLGYRCNQSCLHCHVNAGPNRTEEMDDATIELVAAVLAARADLKTLDITGGAPELHPRFRWLAAEARSLGRRVVDRCNLTILREPGQETLADFLAENAVEVTASLPCYSPANVDRQRGDGVFDASIAGLQSLNALGYGRPGSGLVLNLVYNPQGPVLPPPQAGLETNYRRVLGETFAIEFNALFTLTNMPIQRFGSTLVSKRALDAYLELLKNAFVAANTDSVMCRTLVSVDWQGRLYDCDFNQMLALPMRLAESAAPHLRDLFASDGDGEAIRVGEHCFGCTAGQGSSCGGALEAS